MIKITLQIPKQRIPGQDLPALLSLALRHGASITNSWQTEDAVIAAAHAMHRAEITETV